MQESEKDIDASTKAKEIIKKVCTVFFEDEQHTKFQGDNLELLLIIADKFKVNLIFKQLSVIRNLRKN